MLQHRPSADGDGTDAKRANRQPIILPNAASTQKRQVCKDSLRELRILGVPYASALNNYA